ncbi:hypothetical protein NF212_08850 [Parasalinivibrio latis]|uniref:hypothetical protein n=1 Tax=Parasalinivibrio latis TaxID=2952610 RepID=UPI0030E14F0C
MKKQFEHAIHIGGSMERALKGNYSLDVTKIVQEAVKVTASNFWSFLPATAILFTAQLTVMLIALKMQIGSPAELLEAFTNPSLMTSDYIYAAWVANFSADVLTAPLYAGASLMGLSHAAGFRSKPRHILKGFGYTAAVMVAMGATALMQTMANAVFSILGLYLAIAFSMTTLLICEKQLQPLNAILVSFRAVNRKILPLVGFNLILAVLFFLSIATIGLALIWTLPFLFNLKGIIYREMFGIGIEVSVSEPDEETGASHFDA